MYVMGLDIGSTTTKGVILEDGKVIKAYTVIPSGTGTTGPQKALKELLQKTNISINDVENTVVTGYGRLKYENADRQISELSCHARGVNFLDPEIRTIIDIGGQDIKVMKLDENGKMSNFLMNDKCAAGTGRFLDVMAKIVGLEVCELGKVSMQSKEEVSISSTCTVFAESEVISHLSSDAKLEDIVAGIHTSVSNRVAGLARRIGVASKVAMVGGVAKNEGIVKSMEKNLNQEIGVFEMSQLTGALGAALYAWDGIKK